MIDEYLAVRVLGGGWPTVANRPGHANAAMTPRVYAHALATADEGVDDTLGAELDGGHDD